MYGGMVRTVGGASCLVGGIIASNMAHDAYKQEKERFELFNTNTAKMVKPVKEKALAVAEYLENPKNKWLSTPIKSGGEYLEDIERKYPQTSKYSLSALGLFCLALWLVK